MEYKGTLIVVRDMARSKKFYTDLLGLQVVGDFGANVQLSGGVFLQTADSWSEIIGIPTDAVSLGSLAGELYFETDQLDAFAARLEQLPDLCLLHPLITHPWGQRALRFYDPDRHLVEVAENLQAVAHRFLAQGLTAQEAAHQMDVPLSYFEALV